MEFIKCMRGAGLPIEALIEYVGLFMQGESTVNARKELLIEQRKLLAGRVEEMQRTLARLDYKIERYDKMFLPDSIGFASDEDVDVIRVANRVALLFLSCSR